MPPTRKQLGKIDLWPIGGEEEYLLRARFVGYGSSRLGYHSLHDPGEHARQGGPKCQACRWIEIRVYWDRELYTVDYTMATLVPGEAERRWHSAVETDEDLVDLLAGTDGDGERFFSRPARLALRSMRRHHPRVWEAYEDHPGNRKPVAQTA
jgi:hypothetical protein